MLHCWKAAGVIFTGEQGTWVIKLASIFHSLEKPRPSFTFPVKARRPQREDVHTQGRHTSRHGEIAHENTCDVIS